MRDTPLLLVAVVGSTLVACKDDPPPPDPVCTKVMAAYDKIGDGFTAVMSKTPDGSPTVYCLKLEAAVKASTLLIGDDIKKHIQPAIDGLDGLATKCATAGIASTQQAVKEQIAKLRVSVATTCKK